MIFVLICKLNSANLSLSFLF